MNVLMICPTYPTSFWSFTKTMKNVGVKSMYPPLGLITVAALLPTEWEVKLVDLSLCSVTDAEWDWAELIMITGMIVQKEGMLEQIREGKHRGKKVAIGGPYATSLPDVFKAAGADYLVLDEGEMTIPLFLDAIERGEQNGTFRSSEKPDVTLTPIPRYDLLQLDAYYSMSAQFSRGCPFLCEFCDIIELYGRRPRTKTPEQLIAELDVLYDLGWRAHVFLVDDNFIGNKRNVKTMLEHLKKWVIEKDYPFSFSTEASLDLAKYSDLMQLMVECNFWGIFMGIETPDEESLKLTRKHQNIRRPLKESVEKIFDSGLAVWAGLIIGFDHEKAGAGDRIVRFMEDTNITVGAIGLLQALPQTGLRRRLEKEGRMLDQDHVSTQMNLMNFVPTRPIEEIAEEYIDAQWRLYEPKFYLGRVFRAIMKQRECKWKHKHKALKVPVIQVIRMLFVVFAKYGILLNCRKDFWTYLIQIISKCPDQLESYLSACSMSEHFLEFRVISRDQIREQLKNRSFSPEITPINTPQEAEMA